MKIILALDLVPVLMSGLNMNQVPVYQKGVETGYLPTSHIWYHISGYLPSYSGIESFFIFMSQ